MGFFLTILWLTWFNEETALSDSSGATFKSTTYLLSKVRDRPISLRYQKLWFSIGLLWQVSWKFTNFKTDQFHGTFLNTFCFSKCLIYYWSLILQCLEQCNHLPIFDVKPKWFAFFGKKSRQSGFKDFSSLTNGSRKDRQIFRVEGYSHFTIFLLETLNAFFLQKVVVVEAPTLISFDRYHVSNMKKQDAKNRHFWHCISGWRTHIWQNMTIHI